MNLLQTLTTGRDSAADGVPTEAAAMTAPEIKIEKGTTRGSSVVNERFEGQSNFDGAVTMDDIKSGEKKRSAGAVPNLVFLQLILHWRS